MDQILKAHIARLEKSSPAAKPHKHKQKATIMQGQVKFFDDRRGYGFIRPEDGTEDAFVHVTACEEAGIKLRDGMRVSYELTLDAKKGKMKASNLKAL